MRLSPHVLRVLPGDKIIHVGLQDIWSELESESEKKQEILDTLFPSYDTTIDSWDILRATPFELSTKEQGVAFDDERKEFINEDSVLKERVTLLFLRSLLTR